LRERESETERARVLQRDNVLNLREARLKKKKLKNGKCFLEGGPKQI
jgi:hypothetical protein